MADPAPSRSPVKAKVVRSQKILSTVVSPTALDPDTYYEDSDESTDRMPLPRSHTPGYLASGKSPGAGGHSHSISSRRKTSDLTTRQRSQSASQPSSQSTSRPNTAGSPASSHALRQLSSSGGLNIRATEDGQDGKQKKLVAARSTSAIISRPATTAPLTNSTTPSVQSFPQTTPYSSQPASKAHTAFPPLRCPTNAPDVSPAPASGMYWSNAPVSGAPQTALRAHTATLIGSNIYVFGGCDSKTCFNQLCVLDADSFHWSIPHTFGQAPMPLRAMTCTAVGKKLFIFGGGDGPTYYNDVYVLDTVNFRWSKPRILGERFPSKRRAHTACLHKNGIYVFGGGDGVTALNDIWRLDVADVNKLSWKLISNTERIASGSKDRPRARGYHTASIVGGKLIIFGGSDGGECFDDVWVYDVDSHFWKPVTTPLTYRRLSHTATIVGSYLFVIGGHDGTEYSNDVLLLNLVTMTWDKRKAYGRPPTGRGYHSTVLYDSRLVVIGGFDGSVVFDDVMILELAVHSYYSQISHFTIDV